MAETEKRFWVQPDADVEGAWTVCANPNNPVLVRGWLSLDDANKLCEQLLAGTAVGQSRTAGGADAEETK